MSDQDLYSLHCLRFLVVAIILSGVSVSHGCSFVCFWLDHYLHQHDECGPMGATWLEGVATFTTARDWCTETVSYPNATIVRCFHLMLRVLEYAFL